MTMKKFLISTNASWLTAYTAIPFNDSGNYHRKDGAD